MEFLGIIPARYESSRFPGKPLAKIQGKSMIQHVYEKASLALDDTIGIHFYRDHDDANDDYGADAALIHIEIEYKVDKLGEQ